MGVPNYQLITNFSAKYQVTTNFILFFIYFFLGGAGGGILS